MRFVAIAVAAALTLTACGKNTVPLQSSSSSTTLPTLEATGSITTVDALGVTSPAAYLGSAAVVPLVQVPAIPTNEGNLGLTLWGTKDASGKITALTQAQVQGIGTTGGSVHVFFDSANIPVLFRDDATGYAVALSNESSSQVTFTLCDSTGNADSNVTLTNDNGVVTLGSVADGGSCVLKNAAARARDAHRLPATSLTYTDISSLSNLTKLISAGSYVAGYAFALSAILKFKAHKDNPTQVPVGTAIVFIAVAMALLFLPTILSVTGVTTFDSTSLAQISSAPPAYVSEGSLSSIFPNPDPTP